MADIVNLNQYRKAKVKAEAEAEARNNRLLFGRKRSDKTATRKSNDKVKTDLDNKKLDD
jgi:hypothetical protein